MAVGFVALILGANWLVNGATSIGIRAKLSPLIIGLTVVAFGTSLPELIVNIFSCAKGSPGLAIGNIIGSNTMNILLILGVSAIIWPIDVSRVSIRRDIMSKDNVVDVNWMEGIVLLLMGFAYLLLTILKNSPQEETEDIRKPCHGARPSFHWFLVSPDCIWAASSSPTMPKSWPATGA